MMLLPRLPRFCAPLLFLAVLLAGFILALLPAPESVDLTHHRDKLIHAVAFTGFALLGFALCPAHPVQVSLGLVCYALATEVAQHFTAWRSGDVLDFLTDIAGIALAVGLRQLWQLLRKH